MELKKVSRLFSMFMALSTLLFISSCEEEVGIIDNGGDGNGDTPRLIEDGLYITGEATGTSFSRSLELGRIEGEGFASQERDGYYETFIKLTAGDFQISLVEGGTPVYYGSGSDEKTVTLEGEESQIHGSYVTGMYASGADSTTTFSVAEEGLYHVAFDQSSTTYYIVKVESFGLIGDATPLKWAEENVMTETENGYTITDLEILSTGVFKFRYNNGWKIITEVEGLILFSNFGFDGDTPVMGDNNITVEENGIYTVNLGFSGEEFSLELEKTGDVTVIDYADELYMVGSALTGDDTGWDWANIDAPMVPVNSHPYMFWKIVWLEEGGKFKIAEEAAWSGTDFGGDGEVVDGVVGKGGSDIVVPGASGYYMVVVDLKEGKIAVTEPSVHLLGESVGEWAAALPDYKFTAEGEELTFTGDLGAGVIRMHAHHEWFPNVQPSLVDWWQTEFMIFDSMIEFRGTGGDQEAVTLTEGNYTFSLNFKTGAGAITSNDAQ